MGVREEVPEGMSIPTLKTEEYQYLDSPKGVLLNSDVTLPFFDVTSIDGLDGAPVSPIQSDQYGIDGGFVDAPYEGVRTITVEGTVYASPTALESYLNKLKANFRPVSIDQPFYFRTDDESTVHFVNGKSLGLHYQKTNQRSYGSVDCQFSIVCQDPRIYSTTQRNVTVVVGNSGSVSIQGNRDTPPILRLQGPLTAPVIVTYGAWTLTYAVTIAAGHSVTIDVLNRTVVDETGANQRPNLSLTPVGSWPYLTPGSNVFDLAAAGGTGSLLIQGRSAWE